MLCVQPEKKIKKRQQNCRPLWARHGYNKLRFAAAWRFVALPGPLIAFFFFFFSLWAGAAARCVAFVWFFFFFFVMVVLPFSVSSALAASRSFGFCGSRSAVPPASLWVVVASSVPAGASVSCGCVGGLCALARASFPAASVFRACSFGSGRGAFARRSVALVRAVAAGPSPVWVSFPGRACPSGLFPSASSSACFRGLGSGSWASLAFAIGLGVPAFVWLPPGVSPPAGWGFCVLGGGWFAAAPLLLF